jgi:NAD(P)-dependent dehydrogenase (short-subunit alcohol dehydrogenase family)
MELHWAGILVTGANGGIGVAIGFQLRRLGANLILTARREESLPPFATELGATLAMSLRRAVERPPQRGRSLAEDVPGIPALIGLADGGCKARTKRAIHTLNRRLTSCPIPTS